MNEIEPERDTAPPRHHGAWRFSSPDVWVCTSTYGRKRNSHRCGSACHARLAGDPLIRRCVRRACLSRIWRPRGPEPRGGGVDGTPAGLRGLDEIERHRDSGGPRSGSLGDPLTLSRGFDRLATHMQHPVRLSVWGRPSTGGRYVRHQQVDGQPLAGLSAYRSRPAPAGISSRR